LQNYWLINGDMLDYIGQSDMIIGANVTLRPDRFDQPQSALYLNNGYCTVPPGVYFNGTPFTIMAWIKKIETNPQSRLLDFANGPSSDNVALSISNYEGDNGGTSPYLSIYQGNTAGSVIANYTFTLGVWTHLASVFNGSQGFIYVNGTLHGNHTMSIPNNVQRQNCFIGRSNWHATYADPDANAFFDDIKIYNRALSSEEIALDMTN
jgi:hypothetical protein